MSSVANRTLTTRLGRQLKVGAEHTRGGQGTIYTARLGSEETRGYFKVFTWTSSDERATLVDRTRFLVNAKLQEKSPLFAAAPADWYDDGVHVGVFSPAAPGKSVNDHFESGWAPEFLAQLLCATACATALRILDTNGWCHGDLHAQNLYIAEAAEGVLKPSLIDFDNYRHPSMPAPQNSIGQVKYLAPEQRAALRERRFLAPDRFSERFMLTVLLHELLLLRHPAHAAADDPDRFCTAMTSGTWIDDPARGRKPLVGGYPPDTLNLNLQNLLRRGFGLEREQRPTPLDWEQALAAALEQVFQCPRCAGPVLLDRSKTICPQCRQPYPFLALVLPDGKRLPIDGNGRRVGRDDLGGASSISRLHAVFERYGGETRVTPHGLNGLFRWTSAGWQPLVNGTVVAIHSGDRLRFSDAVTVDVS